MRYERAMYIITRRYFYDKFQATGSHSALSGSMIDLGPTRGGLDSIRLYQPPAIGLLQLSPQKRPRDIVSAYGNPSQCS